MADELDPNRPANTAKDKPTSMKPEPGGTASLAGKPAARPAENRAFADREPSSTSDLASGAVARPAPETEDERTAPLFAEKEARDLHDRWDEIQAGFVDEPRSAVEKADELVAQAMKRLAEMFADERARLETQWNRGENVETEDLRIALQRYRSFFSRLLSV